MHRLSLLPGIFAVTIAAGAVPAHAEWSSDPAANLAVGDRSGAQVQPKLVPTSDGGFYVSWFDNATGGYDVYLQRLDAAGDEQWVHNGVLVADRSVSSTQDYGLAVDTAGYALLAFNDDRNLTNAVTVARVSPAGDLVWGSAGVQVDSGGSFFGPPKVAGSSDGAAVVAWSRDEVLVVQKLGTDGSPMWGTGVTYTPASGSFAVADLHPAEAGTAIVSFTNLTGSFPSPVHLLAQKLAAADGSPLWGAGHVAVFDGGSLQFGNYPPFVPDGAGGAVFAWYTNSPSLQSRVQRVLSNGTEAFAHNGVEVSTNAAQIRVGPSAAFLTSTQETYVFWTEENSTQSLWGLYGQKLDAAGARQWTESGRELVALGANQLIGATTLTFGADGVVAWVESFSFGNDRVHAARVDGAGDFVWNPAIVDLATTPASHSRLVGRPSSAGFVAYAWQTGDTSTSDIVAQNLNPDGTLGPGLFIDGFESGDTTHWSAVVP